MSVDASKKQRVACVGAGPAGLAFASEAAGRGHSVTLFEKESQLGGQFNLAKVVPGKEEFYETIRYYKNMLELNGVDVKLDTEATPELLEGFDSVVLATGAWEKLYEYYICYILLCVLLLERGWLSH